MATKKRPARRRTAKRSSAAGRPIGSIDVKIDGDQLTEATVRPSEPADDASPAPVRAAPPRGGYETVEQETLAGVSFAWSYDRQGRKVLSIWDGRERVTLSAFPSDSLWRKLARAALAED